MDGWRMVIQEATHAHLIVTVLTTQLPGLMMHLRVTDEVPCCLGDQSHCLPQADRRYGWVGDGLCNRL